MLAYSVVGATLAFTGTLSPASASTGVTLASRGATAATLPLLHLPFPLCVKESSVTRILATTIEVVLGHSQPDRELLDGERA